MEPSAKVICDSISPQDVRLTTMIVVMHRFVLAEFNTHRVFSRSSASSRAIPVEKQLMRVKGTPAWPLEWASEQPGMQGGTELAGGDLEDAKNLFYDVRDMTLEIVQGYLDKHQDKSTRLHKSLINRLIEPFMWHTVIVTSTDFQNFFNLRCSPLAQPEIRAAADEMRGAYEPHSEEMLAAIEQMEKAYVNSTPTALLRGEWHLPLFGPANGGHESDWDDISGYADQHLRASQISAARCARVSYLTHDGQRDLSEDLKLFNRLANAVPPHAAPLEHVATPCRGHATSHQGNFTGWDQLRHAYFP